MSIFDPSTIFQPLNDYNQFLNQVTKTVEDIERSQRQSAAPSLPPAVSEDLVARLLQNTYQRFPGCFVKSNASSTLAPVDQGNIERIVVVERLRAEPRTMTVEDRSYAGVLYPMRVGIQFSSGREAAYDVGVLEDAEGRFPLLLIDKWQIRF